MTAPAHLTATLVLSIWLGALAVGQRLDRTLVELDALALATAERVAECARLQATIDLGPTRRAELAQRRASLDRWLAILPSPEVATPERLLERMQECCEASSFQAKCYCVRPSNREPRWGRIGEFLEVDHTHAFEGTLSQFTRFLRELEGSGSFVRVNSFTCMVEERPPASRRSDPRITVALNVSTFRFDAR